MQLYLSVFFLSLYASLYQVFGQTVPKDNTIEANLGSNVILEWNFDGSSTFSNVQSGTLYAETIKPVNILYIIGNGKALTANGEKLFPNNRLVVDDANLETGILKLTLKNAEFKDEKKKFILNVGYSDAAPQTSSITISSVKEEDAKEGGQSSGGSDAGLIAGVIVGVIVFIIIIIVCIVFFKRYQRNKRSTGRVDESNTRLKYGDQDQYAETHVAMDQYKPPDKTEQERHVAKEYAELGPGGGHDGPKPMHKPTHYHEVKRTSDGENARPTREAPPPPKPERGNVRADSEGNLFSETVDV